MIDIDLTISKLNDIMELSYSQLDNSVISDCIHLLETIKLKDISSAPRDGSLILLYTPVKYRSSGWSVSIGSFRVDDGFSGNEEPLFLDNSHDDFSCGYSSMPLTGATHWTYIPETNINVS